jgi:hypothetical protein
MTHLYTQKQKQEVLKLLSIKPISGKVTGKEAAQILKWRAKEEFGIDREYDDASLRRHVKEGNIHADPNSRKSRYPVEEVFDLVIYPTRGRPRKAPEEAVA